MSGSAARNSAATNWATEVRFGAGDDWLIGGSYRGALLDESEVGFQANGRRRGSDRRPLGRRPDDHPGLSVLGL